VQAGEAAAVAAEDLLRTNKSCSSCAARSLLLNSTLFQSLAGLGGNFTQRKPATFRRTRGCSQGVCTVLWRWRSSLWAQITFGGGKPSDAGGYAAPKTSIDFAPSGAVQRACAAVPYSHQSGNRWMAQVMASLRAYQVWPGSASHSGPRRQRAPADASGACCCNVCRQFTCGVGQSLHTTAAKQARATGAAKASRLGSASMHLQLSARGWLLHHSAAHVAAALHSMTTVE
jgi:hypothetical protein